MPNPCPAPNCPADTGRIELLDYRMQVVEKAVAQIADAVSAISENTKQIALLETRHAETRDSVGRAFNELNAARTQIVLLANRTEIMERDMPGLRETRDDVRKIMWGVVSAVALAVVGVVLSMPK